MFILHSTDKMKQIFKNKENGRIEAVFNKCKTTSKKFKDTEKYEEINKEALTTEDKESHEEYLNSLPVEPQKPTLKDFLVSKGVITQLEADTIQ
jgi:NCAIR mutase (PurE)-related protein